MFQQVDNSGGVTIFVIVPGDQLDKGWGQQDTGLGVKDGGSGVGDEVGGDNGVLGVAQDALQLVFGSVLHGSTDVFVGGWGLQVDSQVDNGNVDGRHSHGHTGQLAGQDRQDLTDSLGGTGGGWNDVAGGSSTTSPVLVGWTVDGLLGGGDRVDGGHQAGVDTELVVDGLGQWGQTVGGTGRVRDNLHVWGVLLVVDTDNKHWGVLGRSGNDHLLGTGVQVLGGWLDLLEDTGGVDDVVDADLAPWDVFWVSFVVDRDLLAVDDNLVFLVRDLALVLAVGGVVLEHVGSVLWRNEWVVDRNNLNVWSAESNSQHQSTDSTETVNTNSNSHFVCVMCVCCVCVLFNQAN